MEEGDFFMGLDVYAVLPDADDDGRHPLAPPAAFAGIPVPRGIVVGTIQSFRGGCFEEAVQAVTGRTLYVAYLPPGDTADLAEAVEAAPYEALPAPARGGITADDWGALQRFLAVCRARGYGLCGWW